MHCEWLTQLNQKALKQRLDKVDLVISPSDYITQGIKTRFPEIAPRCCTVPNGVKVERFINTRINQQKSPSNGSKHLLFVGRVCPEKGAHILLEAFQKVLASYPQTKLTLVGPVGVIPYEYLVGVSEDRKVQDLAHFHQDNSWQSYLQTKLAQIQEQGGKVSLPGLVPPSKLNSYFHNADIFIFPSICHEAFGMPIVEAMSAGLPVVATQGGAFPEIVEEGKTGLLVERSNSDALATAIIELIENEDLRESMGELGLKKAVELYSFETMADNLLACFNKD
jgi:glycosyltransferase involved in cell wall biosynthesis